MSLSSLQEWDPLSQTAAVEAALADEMRRQEIRNILRSYTGFYDLFAELIQNSLDALDTRASQEGSDYIPAIWLHIDMQTQSVTITDNGIGLSQDELRLFLQPSMSFKKGRNTRGNKGVGATYLAFGFNYLELATRSPGFEYRGVLEHGRDWVEDKYNKVIKPRIRATNASSNTFDSVDRGASFTIKLNGDKVRPKDLSWIGATSADQWEVILRIKTPLGGLYVFENSQPYTTCYLKVTSPNGEITEKIIEKCEYFYPHFIPGKNAPLSDILDYQAAAVTTGKPVNWPAALSRLSGLWEIFPAEDLINGSSPIKPRLTARQHELLVEHKPDWYVFLLTLLKCGMISIMI